MKRIMLIILAICMVGCMAAGCKNQSAAAKAPRNKAEYQREDLIDKADFVLVGKMDYNKEAEKVEIDIYEATYKQEDNSIEEGGLIDTLYVEADAEIYIPTLANRHIMVDATLKYLTDYFASYIIFGEKLPFYIIYDKNTKMVSFLEMYYKETGVS